MMAVGMESERQQRGIVWKSDQYLVVFEGEQEEGSKFTVRQESKTVGCICVQFSPIFKNHENYIEIGVCGF